MITEISTPFQVNAHDGVDRVPRKNLGLAYVLLAERFFEQRPQRCAKPVMNRDVETLFPARENGGRKAIAHEFPQDELQPAAANLHVLRERGRELHNPVIEEWRAHLERMRHAHAVTLVQNIVG